MASDGYSIGLGFRRPAFGLWVLWVSGLFICFNRSDRLPLAYCSVLDCVQGPALVLR